MTNRALQLSETCKRIKLILEDESDWIAAMSTVACELQHGIPEYHWTGFYRRTEPELLIVGPYQGSHGCLRIPFANGVCGAAARTRETQIVDDVDSFPGHIACSTTTRSEIVVPVLDPDGYLMAVLDVDSDEPAAFDENDRQHLEELCSWLGERFSHRGSEQNR